MRNREPPRRAIATARTTSAWNGSTFKDRRERRQRRTYYDGLLHRRYELVRLIQHRHGRLPDTDDRDLYITALAHCCHPPHGDRAFMLHLWCDKIGGASSDEIASALRATSARRRLKARQFGRVIMLTGRERELLDIRTIEAPEISPAKRARIRKAKRAKAEEGRRRTKGAIPRTEWLKANSKSRDKPWLALGISKATYYRRRKSETGA